jgi:RND family efflux transporter MFP subunit
MSKASFMSEQRPGRQPGHRGRSRAFAILVAISLAGAGIGCSSKDAKAADPEGSKGIQVKVETARLVSVSDTTEYVATLKSRDSAVIMPQVEGQITQIYVHSGDHVSPGTPLLEIDPAKQQATVRSQQNTRAAQEANLKYAEQQYQRISGLYAAGVVSKQDLDQAKSALDAAQAQLESLDAQVREQQVQLHYYKVTAPGNGIVGDIPVRVGDRVTTSTQLTTVDKPGSLEVYVYIPIERSGRLRMNMPVQVVDGEGKILADSRISFISPQVDNTTQTVLIKARIANSRDTLRQSQFIRARIVWDTQARPVVPILAVSRIGGQYFAFVTEQDKNGAYVARQRPVKVGQMTGNDYVVLDGIKPGDKVVVSGAQLLVDGAAVIPQEGGGS